MLVASRPQLHTAATFNYNVGAASLLGGFSNGNGANEGEFQGEVGGGWGGAEFGQMAGWGAAWKTDIYDTHLGQSGNTGTVRTVVTGAQVAPSRHNDESQPGKFKSGWAKARALFNGAEQSAELVNSKIWTDSNGNGAADHGAARLNPVGLDTSTGKYIARDTVAGKRGLLAASLAGNSNFGWGGGFGGFGAGYSGGEFGGFARLY